MARAFKRSFPRPVAAAGIAALLTSSAVVAPAGAADPACVLFGEGTAGAPYEIAEASDLALVATDGCADDAQYRLTGPIDLLASAYRQAVVTEDFAGVFDGGGHTISGLRIETDTDATDRVGFFARVRGGTVRNVIFDAPHIDAAKDDVGVVVGRLVRGTVQDVTVRDPEVKGAFNVGGVIGRARHSVTVSAVRVIGGEVTGSGSVGGVIGDLDAKVTNVESDNGESDIEATFRDVESSASVNGSGSNVGGIAGRLEIEASPGTDVDCSTDAARSVVLLLENVHVRGTAKVANSDSRSTRQTGGLVGQIRTRADSNTCPGASATTRILDSTVSAEVTGPGSTAGLVGVLATSDGGPMNIEIARVRFDGTVTGSNESAGLVGEVFNGVGVDATIEDAAVAGRISGGNKSGGIVGKADFFPSTGEGGRLAIRRATVNGTVTGRNEVGGIAGFPVGAVTIEQSAFSGTVEGTSRDAGGIAGEQRSGAVVRDVIVRGQVLGGDRTGGVAGDVVRDSTVVRAVSITAVVSDETRGLAFGRLSDLRTSVSDVRVATDVAGSTTDELIGVGLTDGVAGNTRAELRRLATYVDWPMVQGWAPADPDPDEGRVWGICPQVNDGFPFLLWQHTSDPCVDSVVATAGPSLTCAPAPSVGTEVTCVVTGGPPETPILWQASYNPVFAGEGVMLDSDGTGTFSFRVPPEALGEEVRIELVEWTAPIALGAAGGPVPTSVPSGGGPAPAGALWTLLGMLGAVAVLVTRRPGREDRVQAGRAP